MQISCPKCNTIYKIDSSDFIEKERNVKCSVCENIWKAKLIENSLEEPKLENKKLLKNSKPNYMFTKTIVILTIFFLILVTLLLSKNELESLSPVWLSIFNLINQLIPI